MNSFKFYLFAVIVTGALFACSEDDIIADPSLTTTMMDRVDENTEIQQANDALFEKYGSRAFYKFNSEEYQMDWTSNYSSLSYVPVPEGNEDAVLRMINFIKDEVFTAYPDNMVRRYLPTRIFLVDSVLKSKKYSAYEVLKVHAVAISDVGPRLAKWSNSKWTTLQTNLVNSMLNSIYDNNKDKLAEFMAAKDVDGIYTYRYDTYTKAGYVFPGEFGKNNETKLQYNMYMAGFSDYTHGALATLGMCAKPSDTVDLGNFLSFIFTTPKSRLDYLLKELTDFPRLKKRTYLLAQFAKNELGMDPVSMQNASCPDDPVPDGYFDTLND
ncbi:MAG: hypothetical protein IK124_08660 [Prevotella sp.]|nr:hypothetical protein [Prevotella sp.]